MFRDEWFKKVLVYAQSALVGPWDPAVFLATHDPQMGWYAVDDSECGRLEPILWMPVPEPDAELVSMATESYFRKQRLRDELMDAERELRAAEQALEA